MVGPPGEPGFPGIGTDAGEGFAGENTKVATTATPMPRATQTAADDEQLQATEYAASATKWKAHTNTTAFITPLNTIIEDTTITNEVRSTQVEEYMINEAIQLGVVKKIEVKAAKNPNSRLRQARRRWKC